jgi:hypothetical protein
MPTPRVTLTDEQLRDHTAQELLSLLENVSADGVLTDREILLLDSWLASSGKTNLPALTYLRSVVASALADRIIIEDERKTIVAAILRIMPPEKSALAKVRFGEAARHEHEGETWEINEKRAAEPASTDQVRCIQAMGVAVPEGCTQAAASEVIASALGDSQPVTVRQMMLLRFWDRLDLADKGRAAADAWIDEWYGADPDRLEAWEMWKDENGDCGREDSPEIVSVGAGKICLERIKNGPGWHGAKLPIAYRIAMGVVAALMLLTVIYFLTHAK